MNNLFYLDREIGEKRRVDSLLYLIENLQTYINSNQLVTFLDNYTKVIKDLGSNETLLLNRLKGSYYYSKQQFKQSLSYFLQCKDRDGYSIDLLNQLGLNYRELSDHIKSSEYFYLSYQLAKKFNLVEEQCKALFNLSTIFSTLNRLDNAEEMLQKIIPLLDNLENSCQKRGMVYSSLSSLYRRMDKIDLSLNYIKKAVSLLERENSVERLIYAYNNQGLIESDKDINLAFDSYHKGLNLSINHNNQKMVATYLANISILYRYREQYSSSAYYLSKSITIFKSLDLKYYLMQSYKEASKLYSKMGDSIATYEYFNKYSTIYEELNSEKSSEKIEKLKIEFETQRKEDEKEIFRLKNIELKKLIEELEATNKELKISNEKNIELERKNSILAMGVTANHEINQPLSIISGSVEILKNLNQENRSQKELQLISKISSSVTKISNILKSYNECNDFAIEEYCSDIKMVKFKRE